MTAILDVVGIRRRYGTVEAVAGVDLAVAAGARHAVIGGNGAGKTTLLHLIAGTVRPSAGRIRLAGQDLTRRPAASRARAGMARTFQTPALMDSLTAFENLVLSYRPATRGMRRVARRRELRHRATEQLTALGLADRAATPVGALPHGQRRLLEIGIAVGARPQLLLLDEPAAGLTDDDLSRVAGYLRGLPRDLTLLLVEHDQQLVTAVAERVTVLHEGAVLTSGTPAEVARHPEVVEVYLGPAAAATLAAATAPAEVAP